MRANTLLLISEHLIARVDVRLRSEATIESFETMVRPDNASLEMLIQAALSLSPKRPNLVWLYSSDFWNGSISIPSDLHAIANSEELNQAAILEAETHSGISSFHSKIAIRRIENSPQGDPQYWVTQIPNSDLDCIDLALGSANAHWIGIAHPNFACPSLDSIAPNPSNESLSIESLSTRSLTTESEIRDWVQRLGKELVSKTPNRPYFAPPQRLVPQRTQTIWSAIAASIVSAVCACAYFYDSNTIHELEQRSQSVAKQLEETDALHRNIQKAELSLADKRKRLREDQLRLANSKSEFELNQWNHALVSNHCANLIDAIAVSADADSWLKRIESKEQRTLLKGIALNEASAHRFASALELNPKLLGHLVSPAQTNTLENELIEFLIAVDLIVGSSDTAHNKRASP